MSMEIFFPGSDTSPDMSLLLVYIQYLANFYGQSRIDHFQAFYAILILCTVLLLIPNFLAACRTVAFVSTIYPAISTARSSI